MNFTEALKQQNAKGNTVLIPDIKCYSPKDGDLMKGRDPVVIAKELEKAGACAISVVTESREFHGSMELLKEICSAVSVPVLRKDFVTCEKDLDDTVQAGARAILLMISCLGKEKLSVLYHAAISRGLTPFVETHTYEEFLFALSLGTPLIGINNRDITVLEKDDGTVAHSGAILHQVSSELEYGSSISSERPFIVVESALRDGDDVRFALQNGADGVLVGTAILNAPDPARQYLVMTRKCGIKICGLMSEADVDAALASDVDICGFVVQYPVDVRWNLDAETAQDLIFRVKQKRGAFTDTGDEQEKGKKAEESVKVRSNIRTCIVTGGDPQEIISLAEKLKPDLVQLHYRETFEQTVQIAEKLRENGTGVIRSIPGGEAAREEMFGTGELEQILDMLAASEVAGALLDSRTAENAASGGGSILQSFDPGMAGSLRKFAAAGKMVLAGGGITTENAVQVMSILKPDYLDIMTGAEDPDGCKSEQLIRELTYAVR